MIMRRLYYLHSVLATLAACCLLALASCSAASGTAMDGAAKGSAKKRAENLQWMYIGTVTVNYYYETLLSQSWLTDKAEIYERMWDDDGNRDEKARDKKEYRALFQGIYYPVRRANKNEWRWMFHADNGYKYYFLMPEKHAGEI